MFTKYIKIITIALTTLLIISCATSHVLVGKKRPPIDPSQVKLYSKSPNRYEEIAIVSASSKSSWAITEQGKMDKVIERLKEEAASLGANGVILQGLGEQSGVMVGHSISGTGTTMIIPANHKNGSGVAIFVIQE